MRLKKLEIQGFKSFADRVEMSFEQGVTGVVGPNGCGKSNISDAVRWVLGEQSAKQLRGAKMEDVIFGGTEKRRRLSFCEVVLTFDNEDRALPIDFSEVSIVRRVYRTGESEYQLNGTACRLKDIVDLFRDTGIGRDGYSLIGQGRVDEILSQKSEDRRQIFEEAAGIVKYKTRKTEAERRMENTRLNLSRVEDILAELDARIEPLREQSEQAREYLQLRDELKGLEVNVFLVRSERYQARIRELTESVETLAASLTENTAAQECLAQEREQVEQTQSSLEMEAAGLRDRVQELIRSVEAQEGVIGVMRERMQADTREKERIAGELAAARDGSGGVDEKIAELKAQIDREAEEIRAADQTAQQAQTGLAADEAALADLEKRSENAKTRVIEQMNRLGDMKSEQARLTAMQTALTGQAESLEGGQVENDAEADQLQLAVTQAKSRLEAEQNALAQLKADAGNTDERVRASSQETDRLNAAVQQLLSRRQEISSRLRLLSEMQKDYDGYNQSVKQVLLRAKNTGDKGIRGVVANLIRVPAKLERALDMVLGGALQNVVVERDEDAKRMIDYLRQNRFGRATFLPIGSVRGRTLDARERQVLAMPGCVGLASELVEYDKEYQGVIDNLLGRTVVAENLDAGIQIQRAGRYQFRLVTLEGDVMHSGGSMTGGSVQSRMTSLLSREREIEESKAKIAEIGTQLDKAQHDLTACEDERGQLKKTRGELFDRMHQQEIACAREEAHLAAAQEELKNHLSRSGRATLERQRIAEQLADVEHSLTELEGLKNSEETAGDDVRREATRLSGEVYEMRTRVDGVRRELNESSVSLAAKKRGLQALEENHARLTSQIQNIDQMIADSARALAEMEKRLENDAASLLADERALTEMKTQLDDARREFDQADAKRRETQAAISEISQKIDALRTQADDFTDRHHRSEMQLTRAETEYKQMQDRIWEDYELTEEGAETLRVPEFRLGDSEKRIAAIRARIREMGSVNVAAVDEYRQTMERHEEMAAQRDDLVKAQLDLQSIVDDLTKRMQTQFVAQFDILKGYFRQTFVELFGGGRAELELTDPKDALNCGIDIVAQPPGKKLQMLSLLSGGERALTAIAILFAMLKLKPTPFCFLDEIEAALDDANIDNFADYLKTYSAKTQFVVVTHRKGTMERCDALYGVAMEEKGVSKLMSVKMSESA